MLCLFAVKKKQIIIINNQNTQTILYIKNKQNNV